MPGIAGIFNHSTDPSRGEKVRTMVETMRHDARFVSGQCDFEAMKASLGWVCEPGSFSDCLPAWNEDRTICLVLAGEEFSGPERMAELVAAGHDIQADNAGYLVHLYDELGPRFFGELNGWFSGVLLDFREGKIILFNDRYGLRRIYYHESAEGFYFASEAKSLLRILPALREIDQRGLAEYFTVGCVLQDRSLFRGISLLPGGSQWTFQRDGRVERKRYFNPETWENQQPLDAAEYGERLQDVFGRLAPRYFRGKRPVAMSLTGGLDSRMILAWSGEGANQPPCYTFAGPYRDCADVRIARVLAGLTGRAHTTLPIGEEFFENFPSLAEKTVYLSDGTMDVSGAVELHMNSLAREIAPVRLTGNYGSEILRSNVAFRPGRPNRSLFTPEFNQLVNEAGETYQSEAAGNRLSFIAFKQVPWHHYSRFSVEQSQITPRSPFLDNDLVALAYRVPRDLATSPLPLLQLIAKGNPELDAVATDRALSRRSRPVFTRLAKAWQEFTAKAEYAYDYGMPTRLTRLDHLLAPLQLERLFLGRHKFYHFRIWYKKRLKGYLDAIADSSSQIPCYVPEVGEKLIRAHTSGRANHTLDLHKFLSVRSIDRTLLRPS
jgi:asparagine synthase (glutamine-hydrolysing)